MTFSPGKAGNHKEHSSPSPKLQQLERFCRFHCPFFPFKTTLIEAFSPVKTSELFNASDKAGPIGCVAWRHNQRIAWGAAR